MKRRNFIVTEEQIVKAIRFMYRHKRQNDRWWSPTYDCPGLCTAFNAAGRRDYIVNDSGDAGSVVGFLRALGGKEKDCYFWERDDKGRNYRLLFLAFMLTWLEDL